MLKSHRETSMLTLGLRSAGAIVLALGVAACAAKSNPRYCDESKPCASAAYPFCDDVKRECESTPISDLGDMAMCAEPSCESVDGAFKDDLRGVDLETPPDLMPECSSYADCTVATAPICGTDGTCRACGSGDDQQCAQHAAGKLCLTEGSNAGQCGDCRPASNTQSANCSPSPSPFPICDVSGICRGCRQHSECSSGFCKLDGSCAATGEIQYVKNDSGATCVTSGAGAGSSAKPWCQIDNATQNSTAHFFIVAKGAYNQVTHTQNPTTMYFLGPGPGLTDANSAVIAENNKAPISINAGGNTLDLTFDGIVLSTVSGNEQMNGHSGVELNGGATTQTTFRLLRSTVKNQQNPGLNLSASTLFIDQCTVTSNAGGGIEVASSNFTITNDLIVGNGTAGSGGSAFGGVTISAVGATKTLANLTVVNNSQADAVVTGAGIGCALNTILENTVLFGNSPSDVSSCTSSTSAWVGATGATNISLTGCAATDVFQGSSNFELLTTANPGKATCILIDKGATPSATLNVPAHDLLGRSRPQRTAWDPGSYEEP